MYIGHGVIVQHFRENNHCEVLEELAPIVENRKYDFNYQQYSYLNKEVQILPVSISSVGLVIIIVAYTTAHFRAILFKQNAFISQLEATM